MELEKRNYTTTQMFFDSVILALLALVIGVLSAGILLGSSISAYYKTLFKAKRYDEKPDRLVKTFFDHLQSTMPQSIFAMIVIYLLAAASIFLIIQFDDTASRILFYFILFEIGIVTLYLFPALAVFKFDGLVHLFKTVGLMANFHFFTTVKVLVPLALLTVLVIYGSPYLLVVNLIVFLFISVFPFHQTFMIYITRIEKADEGDQALLNASNEKNSSED